MSNLKVHLKDMFCRLMMAFIASYFIYNLIVKEKSPGEIGAQMASALSFRKIKSDQEDMEPEGDLELPVPGDGDTHYMCEGFGNEDCPEQMQDADGKCAFTQRDNVTEAFSFGLGADSPSAAPVCPPGGTGANKIYLGKPLLDEQADPDCLMSVSGACAPKQGTKTASFYNPAFTASVVQALEDDPSRQTSFTPPQATQQNFDLRATPVIPWKGKPPGNNYVNGVRHQGLAK